MKLTNINQFSHKYINNKQILFIVGLLLLLLYLLPFTFFGKNLAVPVYDNLDSTVVWMKILVNSGKIFAASDAIIPNMMSGLPRISYGSEFNIPLWFYYFFNDFTAYFLNEIIIHVVAYIGMFLLLQNYFIPHRSPNRSFLIFLISISFSVIPFWSSGGLSVASQPLVLYVLLNIKSNKDTFYDWLILFIIPFYSSFIVSYIFFITVVFLFLFYEIVIKHNFNKKVLFALLFMLSLYIFKEYRLFNYFFFDQPFLSHRSEFDYRVSTFNDSIMRSTYIFLFGYIEHNINLNKYIILTVIYTMFVTFIPKSLNKKDSVFFIFIFTLILLFADKLLIFKIWNTPYLIDMYALKGYFSIFLLSIIIFSFLHFIFSKEKFISIILISQVTISLIAGFWTYEGWEYILSFMPTLKVINISRIFMLQTIIWYLLFAYVLLIIVNKIIFSQLFLILVLVFQLNYAWQSKNSSPTIKPEETVLKNYKERRLSFNSYYAPTLYKDIEKFLSVRKETIKIICLGIEPAIPLYNGFYTLGGYSVNYPIQYKHEFRKIIESYLNEFEEHEGPKAFFDDWGSKLYLIEGNSATWKYHKKLKLKFQNFKINTAQIYKMGGRYIFSAYNITNHKDLNLNFLKKFDDHISYWPVYLYSINPPKNKLLHNGREQ